MPFIPVTNAVEVEMRMVLDNQSIENTLYFSNTSAPEPISMRTLALNLTSWWTVSLAPQYPIEVVLREVVVTDLSSATGPQVSEVPSGGVPGTFGQPALPSNVSLAISFRTAMRGRSFRGRNYVAALTEGHVVNNTVGSATVTAFVDAYNGILTTVTATPSPWVWVIVSRYSGVDGDGRPVPRVA